MKRRRFAENFIRLPKLPDLTFQGLDPVPFLSGHTIAHAAVLLSLLDPFAQGLGNTANLGCESADLLIVNVADPFVS